MEGKWYEDTEKSQGESSGTDPSLSALNQGVNPADTSILDF